MAKKKIIKKKVTPIEEVKEEIEETPAEDVDAFDLEETPVSEEELSEIEQEIKEAESEFEEEIQEERYYVVPLAKKGFEKVPRWKRSKKAIIVLREYLTRHMKPEGEVYISQELNERIWENGIKNPPRKIRIRVTKSVDGIVRAYLA
ncbi:MAG: 50S ribosomal protein L31e [Promethearchaeota archaeon]